MIIIQDYSTSKPELDIKTREKMQYCANYIFESGPIHNSGGSSRAEHQRKDISVSFVSAHRFSRHCCQFQVRGRAGTHTFSFHLCREFSATEEKYDFKVERKVGFATTL